MTEILLHLYKQSVSYDRAKTEKMGDFFALTWLIFAGPVTYSTHMYNRVCTVMYLATSLYNSCTYGNTVVIQDIPIYVHKLATTM